VGNDVDIGDNSNQNLSAQVDANVDERNKGNTDLNTKVQDDSERVLGAGGDESQDDLDKDADASMGTNSQHSLCSSPASPPSASSSPASASSLRLSLSALGSLLPTTLASRLTLALTLQ